jgi:hypothetical protein
MSRLRDLIAEMKHYKFTKVPKGFKSPYKPWPLKKPKKKCSHLKKGDPDDCECDTTHFNKDTVCDWCKRHGREVYDDPGVVCPESGAASWNWNA